MSEEMNNHDFLSKLRIDQSYSGGSIGVEKVLSVVPIRKPHRSEFIRVHPELMLDVHSIEVKVESEIYFVLPAIAPSLAELCESVRLYLAVNRQDSAFLWPVKLPREDSRRRDQWRISAQEAALLAQTTWIRVSADMSLGAYQTYRALADLGDARFPKESFETVVKIAMKDRVIETVDHAVVRQLLGRE